MYLGIDPGANGAAVLIDKDSKLVDHCMFKSNTEQDIWDFFSFDLQAQFCFMEKTHSSPQMGVKSAHSFGMQTGFLRGMLVASSTPFELVTPAKWMRFLGCLTKGDKNVTKQKAQELWPKSPWKITHGNADAMLIAEYCRRSWHEKNQNNG
jgi:hypothetical protein